MDDGIRERKGTGQRLGHIAASIRTFWLVILWLHREQEQQRKDYDTRLKQRDEYLSVALSSLGATIRTSNEAMASAIQELAGAVEAHRQALTVFLGDQISHQNRQVDFALSGVTSAQRENNRLMEEALRQLNTQNILRRESGPHTPPRSHNNV